MSAPLVSARMSCFVTGTDTEVGKTWIATALIRTIAATGHSVIGMKPIAAGADATPDGLRNADALALAAASTVAIPYELTNPYCLIDPLSPDIAASRAGITIDIETILRAYREITGQADSVVVEGAGGWLVPINPTQTMADLAVALQLPVVLVVGLRLGCVNHALLSVAAIEASGLPLMGWVANQIDPHYAALEENLANLRSRIAAPQLGFAAYGESAPALNLPIKLRA
jgi:dethiobiotin synthetase